MKDLKPPVVRPAAVLAGARLDEAGALVVLEGPVSAPTALFAPLHEEGVVLLRRPEAVEVVDLSGVADPPEGENVTLSRDFSHEATSRIGALGNHMPQLLSTKIHKWAG